MREKATIGVLKKASFGEGPQALDECLSCHMMEGETVEWYRKSFIEEIFEYALQQMPGIRAIFNLVTNIVFIEEML